MRRASAISLSWILPAILLAGAAPPSSNPPADAPAAQEATAPIGLLNMFGSAYPLPAPIAPAPQANTVEGAQSIARLRPRGAATLYGTVVLTASTTRDLYEMEVHLIGATPGVYDVLLFGNGTCPPEQAPPDVITGDIDDRRRPRMTPAARGSHLWESATEVRVSGDGRADLVKPLWPSDLGWPAKSVAIMLRERPGTVNPSLADSLGLAACTVMRVPRVGNEPGEG